MSIINFNLRISEEINDKIVKIAEEQGRSKNKQIEQILKEYINKYEKEHYEMNQNGGSGNTQIMNINK